MLPGYRVASGVVLTLLLVTLTASYYGWGLADDAAARARSVRQGSVRSRAFHGGGPGFGK